MPAAVPWMTATYVPSGKTGVRLLSASVVLVATKARLFVLGFSTTEPATGASLKSTSGAKM